jgi:OmpA-OmpF porin, OOP family
MRKFILSAALLALSVPALQAHASDTSGWFANVGVGSTHFKAKADGYSFSDNTTGTMFNVGWRKGVIGVEAGYTDLGSVSYSDGYGDSVKVSADGFTAGLNLHYNVNEKFYVGGRGGAFFWTAKDHYNVPGYLSGSDSTSSTGWYAGVGAGYNFTPNWSAAVNYNYYDMNKSGGSVKSDMYGVSLEYSF